MAEPAYVSVRESARRLGVHENTIRNWCNQGVIRRVTLPNSGYRRIPVTEVERLIALRAEEAESRRQMAKMDHKRQRALIMGLVGDEHATLYHDSASFHEQIHRLCEMLPAMIDGLAATATTEADARAMAFRRLMRDEPPPIEMEKSEETHD